LSLQKELLGTEDIQISQAEDLLKKLTPIRWKLNSFSSQREYTSEKFRNRRSNYKLTKKYRHLKVSMDSTKNILSENIRC
jgi:hypothetical protein